MKRLLSLCSHYCLDVIAWLACIWVAFLLMTQSRDLGVLIDEFNKPLEYDEILSSPD